MKSDKLFTLDSNLLCHLTSLFLQKDWDFDFCRREFRNFYETNPITSGLSRRRRWNVAWYQKQSEQMVLARAQKLLNSLFQTEKSNEPFMLLAKVGQVLTKVIASKDLSERLLFSIPIILKDGSLVQENFIIDRRFDLWKGIPGYGLISLEHPKEFPPLLLFRATNVSLRDEFAVASIATNFDPHGPSWSLFHHCKQQLVSWLREHTFNGKLPARICGYSQGGALAMYLATYAHNFISKHPYEPSLIFDCPGVCLESYYSFNRLQHPPNLQVFLTKGDVIPKFGLYLFGEVYEIAPNIPLTAKEAHYSLSLLQEKGAIYSVDLDEENNCTFRQMITHLRYNTTLLSSLYKSLNWIYHKLR